MEQRKLGHQGLEVSAPGLGCMGGMSEFYGATDEGEAVAVRTSEKPLCPEFGERPF